MELILISNTKLKIMLDENDMRQYKISCETDCAELSTRKAIRSLLDRAREEVGFRTDGEEIFVQLYTSKHGGCELFVTKCKLPEPDERLNEEEKSKISMENLPSERRGRKAGRLPDKPAESGYSTFAPSAREERKSNPRRGVGGRIAFSFPDLESLLTVCRILDKANIHPDSRAFTDESGAGYLLLWNTGLSAYQRLDRLTFILEYGKRENPDCLSSYISEHGRVICEERAVETLCRL